MGRVRVDAHDGLAANRLVPFEERGHRLLHVELLEAGRRNRHLVFGVQRSNVVVVDVRHGRAYVTFRCDVEREQRFELFGFDGRGYVSMDKSFVTTHRKQIVRVRTPDEVTDAV